MSEEAIAGKILRWGRDVVRGIPSQLAANSLCSSFLGLCSPNTLPIVSHSKAAGHTCIYQGIHTLMGRPEYDAALTEIDRAHALDPNKVPIDSEQVPYELHYARKMTSFLDRLEPEASETLRLAVRAQHFRRWEVPRGSYPMDRQGYFNWRTGLKKRQAEQAAQICRDCGYSDEDAARVAALIRKENMKQDDESQTLEDVACLVFLDDQFEAFQKEHDENKLVSILKKTWGKMSNRGHELALQLPMTESARSLVGRAVA